jgi:hypothetical protein
MTIIVHLGQLAPDDLEVRQAASTAGIDVERRPGNGKASAAAGAAFGEAQVDAAVG